MESGIALYSIELNGCLNGVYTNDGLDGEIFNEIARMKNQKKMMSNEICGEYECFYFDGIDGRAGWSLIIEYKNPQGKTNEYIFTWKNKIGNTTFIGSGYKMNERQIAVHYVPAQTI